MARNELPTEPIDIEQVAERALENAADDDAPLDFYGAAVELGATQADADHIDEILTERTMRARGVV